MNCFKAFLRPPVTFVIEILCSLFIGIIGLLEWVVDWLNPDGKET